MLRDILIAGFVSFAPLAADTVVPEATTMPWAQLLLQGGFGAVVVLLLLKVIPSTQAHVVRIQELADASIDKIQTGFLQAIDKIREEHLAVLSRVHDEHRKTLDKLLEQGEARAQTFAALISEIKRNA